jgi:carbon-monoxide dehydrogenase medium subunit
VFTTALVAGEIITAVEIVAPAKAAYAKFPQLASRYAMVGVLSLMARRERGLW